LFLNVFCYITMCPMMPRFIISVRELYDRDPRRQGIDTGFGVLSQPITNENATTSVIAFVDVAPGQGQIVERDTDESEAIQFEVLADNNCRV
ncbi:hypothetical protein J3R83DRAFT_113, partial [Lanmaoa asiatica]